MRKVIVSEFLTLNGVMEEPAWSLAYWTDEIAEFKRAELFAVDALLLGRVTYEGFAAAWPSRTDEAGYADRINGLPKYVVSTSLKTADWSNSTVVRENVPGEVHKLKQQPGQDILVFGSGQLVQTLIEHDLVDGYHLLIYPVVLASGKRLFKDGSMTELRLVDATTYSSGALLLRYERNRKDAEEPTEAG